eukprot:gene9391-11536_t
MLIKENNKNVLELVLQNRKKEWGLGAVIASIGLLPFIQDTDEIFIKLAKFVFLLTFILIGLLNIHDEYFIRFDAKKHKVIIRYQNILEIILRDQGKDIVLDLDLVKESRVQELEEGKRKLYKLVLSYSDGLSIGVTETLYFSPSLIQPINLEINKWLQQNKSSGGKQSSNYNNDNNNDYEDDEDYHDDDDEEEKKKLLLKKRIVK